MGELIVKLRFKNDFERIIRGIVVDAASKALDEYRPILKKTAQELAPYDTGALRASHRVRKKGKLAFNYGFEETNRTRAKSRSKKYPNGFFYGLWYHEVGAIPNGPSLKDPSKRGWLRTAWYKSLPVLKKSLVKNARSMAKRTR